MKTVFHASVILLPVFYTLLVAAYARLFVRGQEGIARLLRPLLLGTLALQLLSILVRGFLVRACPLGSEADFAAVLAFSILGIYFVLELSTNVRSTGVFAVFPALVIHIVSAVAILEQRDTAPGILGVSESIHVFAMNIALAAIVLCSVYGVLYLFMYTAIKRGWFGLFYQRTPSLETLSELNSVGASMAFIALTVSLGVGAWYRHASPDDSPVHLLQPVVLMGIVLWLLYGACLAGRFFGFGGKRLAYTTVLGLLLMTGMFVWGLSAGFHP